MRVITGKARGRKLREPTGMDIRPTTDMVKESVFNIIQFKTEGARVLDLFAGTGQLGIEALSRGAKVAYFVENARASQLLIRENLEFTKLADRARYAFGDVQAVLGRLAGEEPFDIIFMDPPFLKGLERQTLELLADSPLPAKDGLIVVEASPKTDFDYLEELGYVRVKERVYGMSQHLFLRRIKDMEEERA